MRTFVKAATPPDAKTLEASWYVSEEVFKRERERIFARTWICAGRLSDIPSPGDFFLTEIAGESLIVTRDESSAIHAFYNVCRHRGTRMCEEPSGRLKGSIQCPYHAWTYGLDGHLLTARNMADTENFDRAQYPLAQAHVAQLLGFIFVSLDPQVTFEQWSAPLKDRFDQWEVQSVRAAGRKDYEIRSNWKLVFQNYSECYHCPVIHPQLERLSPSDSGRNDFCEGPFLGGYSALRTSDASLTSTGHSNRAPFPRLRAENKERVYYYTIFPSLLLSLHPNYVMAHFVRPIAVDRTSVVCEWYFDPREMTKPEFDPGDAVDFWDLTNRQDWHVSELSQLGIASRAYVPGPYSQQEGLLHAFDRYYLAQMS